MREMVTRPQSHVKIHKMVDAQTVIQAEFDELPSPEYSSLVSRKNVNKLRLASPYKEKTKKRYDRNASVPKKLTDDELSFVKK